MDPGPGSADSLAIGVVTGLASEAAVVAAMLNGDAPKVFHVCAGASAQRAAVLARQLVDRGVGALLSFGIAGAVAPDLVSGELVLPDEVLRDDAEDPSVYGCDPTWREALSAALAEVHLTHRDGLLVSSKRLWRESKDKQAVFEITGGQAIDMESGAVAAIAAEAGLPFLAVRAVADRARDSLPELVETGVKPDGRPAVARAVAALVRRPGDIPATLRLARQSELALAKLRMLEAVKGVLFGGF